jgi:hypothetical protein
MRFRLLVLVLALRVVLPSQNPETACFPNCVESDLLVIENSVQTTLAAAITTPSETTITVASATGILINAGCWADFEIFKITGKAGPVLTVVRGFDRTTAATHSNGATLICGHFARHDNQKVAELLAHQAELKRCSVESELTIDSGGSISIPNSGCFRVDTFNNDPSDDLNGLVCPAGIRFTIVAEDAARTIVIKSGAVFLMRFDQQLDNPGDSATFWCRASGVATRTGRSDGGN